MALEQIFAQILEDANIEARGIIDAASKEADTLIQEAEKEAGVLKDKIIAVAKQESEFTLNKEMVAKKLSAQKDLLRTKKFQLDNCFQEALHTLLNLEDSLYRNLIKNMLTKISPHTKDFGVGVNFKEEAEIIFSSHDKKGISQDYIDKVNPHLKLSFSDDIHGGFILQTKELIIDNSLGNILADLRLDLEPQVAEILFNDK